MGVKFGLLIKEEYRWRVSEKKVPRRMFEPHNEEVTESWRVAHNMELCTEI
jgi:hypothetical protein